MRCRAFQKRDLDMIRLLQGEMLLALETGKCRQERPFYAMLILRWGIRRTYQ